MLKYKPYYNNSLLQSNELKAKIYSYLEKLSEARKQPEFNQEEDFVYLPEHKNSLDKLDKILSKTKEIEFDFIIYVGIGGANLGVMTVSKALQTKKEIIFLENIDPDYNHKLYDLIRLNYEKGKKALFITASKSGTTVESLANFTYCLAFFKEIDNNWQKRTFIVTTKDSLLAHIAKKENLNIILTHNYLVDRYSVLGLGSLFTLDLLGINIKELLNGASLANKRSLSNKIEDNDSALLAFDIFRGLQNNLSIYNLFIFSQNLETYGRWQRQLIAESLGKEGKGVLPIYSIGTTDLHSMTQLYLDGPKNIFTSFLTIEKHTHNEISDPYQILSETKLQQIFNKTHCELLSIITNAIKTTYNKQDLPFSEIIIPKLDEHALGELLQTTMIAVTFLGQLLNVNPFDQNAVELYKEEIRKIL